MREIGSSEIHFGDYMKNYGEDKERVIEKYKRYLEGKTTFPVFFLKADNEGNLITYDSGVMLKMENKEIVGREYEIARRAYILSQSYTVQVTDIDMENGIVYVSHEKVRSKDRESLEKILEKEIGECIVPARVITVLEGIILLDIGGLGIPGYLWIRNWSRAYTQDLSDFVKKNDIIKVAVIEKNSLTSDQRKKYFHWSERDCYECSRKAIEEIDPWEKLGQSFQIGDIVHVRCRHIAPKGSYFWGYIDGIPEITVFCSYSKSNGEDVLSRKEIILGELYDACIYRLNENEHIIRANVFRRIENRREK